MKDIALTIFILLTLVLAAQQCSNTRKISEQAEAYDHLHDTATTYKNKYGQAAAVNKTIILSRQQLVKVNAAGDSLLKHLQKVTDRYTEAATTFTVAKEGQAVGTTTRIVYIPQPAPRPGDTTRRRPPLPRYYGKAHGDGFTADIKAGPDSMQVLRYSVQQELAVNFSSKKRRGLFKGREQTVEVTATSPGGKVLDVRAFQVPAQPPKRGLWFAAGFAAGFLGRPFITPVAR